MLVLRKPENGGAACPVDGEMVKASWKASWKDEKVHGKIVLGKGQLSYVERGKCPLGDLF